MLDDERMPPFSAADYDALLADLEGQIPAMPVEVDYIPAHHEPGTAPAEDWEVHEPDQGPEFTAEQIFRIHRAETAARLTIDKLKDGTVLGYAGTMHNLHQILTNDPTISDALAYDEMAERPCFTRPVRLADDLDPIQVTAAAPVQIRAEHLHDIRTWLSYPEEKGGWGMGFKLPDVQQAVGSAARNRRYHPVKKMFEKDVWDGVPRIDTIGIRYLGLPDNIYSREVFRLLMLAMIARVHQPGHDFQSMVIIEGQAQGSGKSTFVKTLSGGFYNEVEASDMKDARSKAEALVGSLLIEMPELTALRKLPEDEAKQLISRGAIRVRGAWGTNAEWTLLQSVIIGTTNRRAYLTDPTGNRRMLVVRISESFSRFNRIDNEGLRKELPQLYAEALSEYRRLSAESEDGTLDLNLSPEAAKIQERLTATAMVVTEADSLKGRLEEILMTPVTVDPCSIPDRHEHLYLQGPDGQIYRRFWFREQLLDRLHAKGYDIAYLRGSKAKGNDMSVALEGLKWLVATGGQMIMPDERSYGRQRVLEVQPDEFFAAMSERETQDGRDREAPVELDHPTELQFG